MWAWLLVTASLLWVGLSLNHPVTTLSNTVNSLFSLSYFFLPKDQTTSLGVDCSPPWLQAWGGSLQYTVITKWPSELEKKTTLEVFSPAYPGFSLAIYGWWSHGPTLEFWARRAWNLLLWRGVVTHWKESLWCRTLGEVMSKQVTVAWTVLREAVCVPLASFVHLPFNLWKLQLPPEKRVLWSRWKAQQCKINALAFKTSLFDGLERVRFLSGSI